LRFFALWKEAAMFDRREFFRQAAAVAVGFAAAMPAQQGCRDNADCSRQQTDG
jgi:hypothetical protein